MEKDPLQADQVRSQRTFPAAINRQQQQQKLHKLDRFCDNDDDDDDNDNKNRGQARATATSLSLSPSPSPVGYNSFSVITWRPSPLAPRTTTRTRTRVFEREGTFNMGVHPLGNCRTYAGHGRAGWATKKSLKCDSRKRRLSVKQKTESRIKKGKRERERGN